MCTEQRVFEQAFRTYRQGLRATCRGYQGCNVTIKEQFMDLLSAMIFKAVLAGCKTKDWCEQMVCGGPQSG